MHPLEKKLLTLCRDNGLLKQNDHLVLGVSGGPDSMALLHALCKIASELGVTMIVAHVDHGLRPEAARFEEELVRKESAALGLECVTCHLDVTAHAKKIGLSIEEAARDLRYGFFEEIAERRGAGKIVVAHTADDQAEEVLLRLLRGAGRKGLSGMTTLRDGRIVRPFLTIEKSRILSYLHDRQIPFAHDSSNSDQRYLRNKIRLDLLPYLARFNPNIKETLRQTATILRDEDAFLDAHVAAEYSLLMSEKNESRGVTVTIPCAQFNQCEIAIRRRLLEKALTHLGSKPGYRQIDGLISLAATPGHGHSHLKNGLRALTEHGVLRLCYPRPSTPQGGIEVIQGEADRSKIKANRGNLVDEVITFSLLIPQPGRYLISEIGQEVVVELMAEMPTREDMKRGEAEYFDANRVSFPLTMRNRLPGDRFRPMNCKGSKTVADFLTDLKVEFTQRNTLPIVISGGRIIAVLGGRIDHEARVTDTTTEVLKVSIRPA
jgi:tRNA(Ile)-lysidine synthase